MASTKAGALAGLRLLTKGDILAAPDLATEIVEVPEWGGSVRVRALDVNRRQAWLEYGTVVTRAESGVCFEAKPFAAFDAAFAALAIVDENDEPLFSLAEVEELGSKNPAPIARIAAVARRLSKMGDEASDEAKAALDPTNGASPSD
jgi:hypothetical protein